MELRQLRYFAAAAEEENFRRAAERLHVAQPALSRQIAMLEAELGVSLFVRARRRVSLSAAGRSYLRDVNRLLGELSVINQRVQQVEAGVAGLLQIAFHETAGRSAALSGALQGFRARYPDVEVRLLEMTSQQQVEPLRTGHVDAGLLYPASVDAAGMAHFSVSTDRFYFAVRSGHPLARRKCVRLAELADQPFARISRRKSPRFHDLLLAACVSGGLAPRIVQETESESTLVNLVAIGMAAAFLISSSPRSWHPDIVLIPVADLNVALDLHLVWKPQGASTHLLNFLREIERVTADAE